MGATGPTIQSTWLDASARPLGDDLLEWVPDAFAFAETVLHRTQAYRFAVSPPAGAVWPPPQVPGWPDAVARAAEQWCAWATDRRGGVPELVADAWATVRDGAATALDDVADGRTWRLCSALLTLHAVADEGCAGMGVTVRTAGGRGHRHRARARELLATTGSLARLPTDRLRVLPKVRTPAGGISFRSLSRYACVRDAGIDVRWHRAPVRRAGPARRHGNILLLPWPLRVRERDFRPVRGSVQRTEDEPFGLFTFSPAEQFDVDTVERVLVSALDEVDRVDVVVLPESSIPAGAVDALEAVLDRHDVSVLVAGARDAAPEDGGLPGNWVHLGVHVAGRWWHYRQDKHHRWFLDGSQIEQYHLGGALHPSIRWWEAMRVPRRSVQLVDLGGGITFVAVICEDLARLDEVADLVRTVGPTLVATVLLDGPQLASRWTARYASVLADDPGSAVLTLTAYGFVQRSRPPGRSPSSVVALWKDASRGLREIDLDRGSHGVVVTVAIDRARRRAADGRAPVDNVAELFVAGVHQVRAADGAPPAERRAGPRSTLPAAALDTTELSVVASWASALGEAVARWPDQVDELVADAGSGAEWRRAAGAPEPSDALAAALARLGEAATGAVSRRGDGAGAGDPEGLAAALLAEALATPPAA